jgi:desulfoferrodoxin (superoxide reductase-like protein)
MKNFRTLLLLINVLIIIGFILTPQAFADESSVKIESPDDALMGEEIVIILHISHSGNNFIHYTERVELRINGHLAKQWEYSMFSKPEGEKFTVSFAYPAEKNLEIEAMAFCNLHGSKNTAVKTVFVESTQSNIK